ncbi:DUF1905 domain-containing protein [Gramella sp. GC03-9]|uniref:DUF1905 domain-containing protein n=1 Tax=Christiangramia oceanisediminis TaxID=2920386 RepID=A0A9X2I8V4_9FLAO|nr:DUF1905 domain-containing protein [Gramella oceanisediminis]
MQAQIKYEFSATLWKYEGKGGWFFVSLPKEISEEIRNNLKWQEEGWGRMKVTAGLDRFRWETAIWFDTKIQTYLLPIKADIRSRAGLQEGEVLDLSIWI